MRLLATTLALCCAALTAFAAGPAHAEERGGVLMIDDSEWDGDPVEACLRTSAAIVVSNEYDFRFWCAKGVITRAAAEACRQGAIDAALLVDSYTDVECDDIVAMTFPPNERTASDRILLDMLAELKTQTTYLRNMCIEALGTLQDCKRE